MTRIKITVRLDVDPQAMAEEYGDDSLRKVRAAKDHIAKDLLNGLLACPYADALSDIDITR